MKDNKYNSIIIFAWSFVLLFFFAIIWLVSRKISVAIIGTLIVFAIMLIMFFLFIIKEKFNESIENLKIKKSLFLSVIISLLISATSILSHYYFFRDKIIFNIAYLGAFGYIVAILYRYLNPIWHKLRKLPNEYEEETYQPKISKIYVWLTTILLSIILTLIFTNPFFLKAIDYHRLEKEPNGSICSYYVIAENNKEKKYTLPAEVLISFTSENVERYNGATFNYDNYTEYKDEFIVTRIYFKNGGYLYFEDALSFSKPNQKAYGTDQSGRDWDITLTNRHIKNQYIKEYFPLKTTTLIHYSTIAFVCLITYFVMQYDIYKQYLKAKKPPTS